MSIPIRRGSARRGYARIRQHHKSKRKGVVVIQVAVALTLLLGMAALTIDLGAIYNTKADLQRTADASALAAAAMLSEYGQDDPISRARQAAVDYVERNAVLNRGMTLDSGTDVTFGRAIYDEGTGSYTFEETDFLPDAVKVRVRHTEDSPNGAVPLYFAKLFGRQNTEIAAEAIAVMVPRDIAIVADLSGSHNDDSEFRHYKLTEINLWDVWDGLDGQLGSIGGSWDPDDLPPDWVDENGFAVQAAGPAWGYMKEMGYGTETIAADYDPTADDGLIRMPYNVDWNEPQLETYLRDLGYIESEVNAIMSSDFDADGAYNYRVCVALGLTYWNSGHGPDPDTGELPSWQKRGIDPGSTGNGNDWIGSSEQTWTETFGDRSVSQSRSVWLAYADYVKKSNSQMAKANYALRYRYGVKTFTNFLLESRPTHSQTPELSNAPAQPMQAVKDAVEYMADYIDGLDSDDQVSLEIYAQTARHEVDLTIDVQEVKDRLHDMQAAYYDHTTNVGGGIGKAIEELTSERARSTSHKMVILLTDGIANVGGGGYGAKDYARVQAQAAADLGFKLFAVSVGAGADTSLMQELANIGHGEHFHAAGSIEEYSDELEEIFRRLGGKRPVELIR